ncbi:MAG TPA: hypothetical protein VGM53_22190 [Streptosporangiaceae bacterium]
MSVPPAAAGGARDQRALLFTPGARLGWIFRDRRELADPYPEAEPDEAALREQAVARAAEADAAYQKMRKWLGGPSLGVLLILLVLSGCERQINPQASVGGTLLTALVLGIPGIVITSVYWQRREQAKQAVSGPEYQQALESWQQRATAHEHAELARLHDAHEWGSAEPPTQRVDVFGGSLWGWRALLTTHGASVLSTQPLLAVDLTGEMACGELIELAEDTGVPSVVHLLPDDMGRCGLLAALSPAQLADALAEAIHAGAPGGARADRAVDLRVLEQLTGALGDDVTPVRLAAAAQAALGHPVSAGQLTPAEEALVTGKLFPPSYRQQIGQNLVRLDAFLADLARYADTGGAAAGRPASAAYFTCLALESRPRGARIEMLTALVIQWLTVQVTGGQGPAPAVIIAGADEITRAHLERLSTACERREVPLTLMFRHLRDDGLGLLGGGTAAFMRLGNHTEAELAASFIGRQHKFVLSQLTATLGGNETHTRTETEGYGVSQTRGISVADGWHRSSTASNSETSGSSHSSGNSATSGSSPTSGSSHSSAGSESRSAGRSLTSGRSGSVTRSWSRTVSRNWSVALSWAHGSNWTDAKTRQRVYEYAVEPTVLQNLPDHALLLVARAAVGPDLRAVECDPSIITLPRVSTQPLVPAGQAPGIGAATGPATAGMPAWPGQQDERDRGEQPVYLPPADLPPPSREQWLRPDRSPSSPPSGRPPAGSAPG